MKRKLFKENDVKAILEGRKTQFREVIRGDLELYYGYEVNEGATCDPGHCYFYEDHQDGFTEKELIKIASKHKVGDVLWVPEAFVRVEDESGFGCGYTEYKNSYNGPHVYKWNLPTTMPEWQSRIKIKITCVWVERLQDISEEDASAEGVYKCAITKGRHFFGTGGPYKCNFKRLWDKIYGVFGDKSWDSNPFVFAYEFEVVS